MILGIIATKVKALIRNPGFLWVKKFLTNNTVSWGSICEHPIFKHVIVVGASSGTEVIRISKKKDEWSWPSNNNSALYLSSICWGIGNGGVNGTLVAVGYSGSGRIVYSPSDANYAWYTANPPFVRAWRSVCWSDTLNRFVAVASDGTGAHVAISSTGYSWQQYDSPANNKSWQSVVWAKGLNLFVAVGADALANCVMTSPNGITWTLRTAIAGHLWRSLCWSEELQLLVAVSAGLAVNGIMTSPDGINWTLRTCPANNDWYSVCWGKEPGKFVAVATVGKDAGLGNQAMVSSDGINWELRSTPPGTWRAVCWCKGYKRFYAVSNTGTKDVLMISE